MYIPDNYDLYRKHEAEQMAEIERFPLCSYCGATILDDYLYDFDGEIMCETCLKTHYRKWTVDYCER